jgi:putative acetyltransferase
VEIRGRTAADDAAIRRLNDDTFGGHYESRLIEDLRAAGLDAVELVAVENDDIVGHILFSWRWRPWRYGQIAGAS